MRTMTTSNVTEQPVKRFRKRPWHGGINHPIPWGDRTYCLNVDTGLVEILPDKFFPQKDPLTHKVVGVTKGAIKPDDQNPQRYPKLTQDEVERLFAESEKSGDSFKICYARLFGLDALNGFQQEKLALAPDAWAEPVGAQRKAESANATEKLNVLKAAASAGRPGVVKKS